MSAIPIIRSQYWNPSTGTVRGGSTAHGESLVDVESGLLPLARATASSLHTWGVADGLAVSAVTGADGVTVAPGAGLDALGRLVVLATGGVAVIDPAADPSQVLNVPTVAVGPDGVVLPTAGTAAGAWLVTLTFREVQDQGQLSNAPVLLLAPWVRLQGSADVPDDGHQLVLATVTLDASGLVTALDATRRRLSGLPTARVELRRPVAAGGAKPSTTQQAGAVLAVPDGGGLSLTATGAGPDVPVLAVDAALQTLALLPGGGRAGIGVGIPAPGISLHVEGSAVHSGGVAAGLSFADRGAGSFVEVPANGERWLWYSQDGTARLWSGSDVLTVATSGPSVALDVARRMRVQQGPDDSAGIWFSQRQTGDRGFVGMAGDTQIGLYGAAGAGWGLTMDVTTGALRFGADVGRPDGPCTLSLWGSQIGDVGNGVLFLRSGGAVVAFDGNDSVGIGTASPGGRLGVVSTGTAVTAENTQDGLFASAVLATGMIGVLTNARATGVWAAGKNYGVVGSGATAGQFFGNVSITGSLSKGGGGFRIDHPLDPANRYLSHSFVESPEMLNVYRGTATTDADGAATVDLPDYVDTLNADFTYHLTVLGEPAAVGVTEPMRGNRFGLRADRPGAEVCWLLLGVRQDPWAREHRIQVEEDKPEHARDRFLHPEVYGGGARAFQHPDDEAIFTYAEAADG